MLNNLYSIKDVVAEEFGPIFQAINDGVAVRSTVHALKNSENPNEYKLYCLGAINTSSGSICPEEIREISIKISSDRKLAVLEELHHD